MLKFRRIVLFAALFAVLLPLGRPAFALPALAEQDAFDIGDYSPEIAVLQTELGQLGLYSGDAGSVYTAETKAAVTLLQERLGVQADGIYGEETAAAYAAALESGLLVLPEEPVSGPLATRTIGIDPGHQEISDEALEQLAPGSTRTKSKMSRGASGVKTGMPEYKLNLQVAVKLQALLQSAGAKVVMTRETNDVQLSNLERAQVMNAASVDLWIRLHCDSAADASLAGPHALIPSRSTNAAIYKDSLLLAQSVLSGFCLANGAAYSEDAIRARMDQTGFNWSESPVVTIEMGYLSNPQEDVQLAKDSYQLSCANGIYNGITAYYAALEAAAPETAQ